MDFPLPTTYHWISRGWKYKKLLACAARWVADGQPGNLSLAYQSHSCIKQAVGWLAVEGLKAGWHEAIISARLKSQAGPTVASWQILLVFGHLYKSALFLIFFHFKAIWEIYSHIKDEISWRKEYMLLWSLNLKVQEHEK